LICVAESGKKYEMAIKFGTELGIAIVLPHWSVTSSLTFIPNGWKNGNTEKGAGVNRFEESLKLNQLVPMDIYRFPSPPYSTSLRDPSLSTKPFIERLTDYWKQRLNPSASTSASTSTSTAEPTPPIPVTTPTTATHVILGLGEGMSKTTKEKLRDSEKYFKTTNIEGFPSQQLQRELNDSTLGLGGGTVSSANGRNGSIGPSSSKLNSTLSAVDEAANAHPSQEDDPNSKKGGGGIRDIFRGKRFYLSSDLGLSAGIEKAITSKIESFGGSAWSFGVDGERELLEEREEERGRGGRASSAVSSNNGGAGRRDSWARRRIAEKRLRESDYVVLRNREGWEYWLSYSLELSIGTPPWLFYNFANQSLTSPLARLIHYPPPSSDGVSGFRGKTITVSNYTGLAREYVRTLIELLGATYEGTMGRNTDYVVTAS
jgi:hypothetical protein